MKKMAVLAVATLMLASCGNGNDKDSTVPGNEAKASQSTVNQAKDSIGSTPDSLMAKNKTMTAASKEDQKKGLTLIAKSDCVSCHHVTEKMIGPSYAAVAKRYEGKAGSEELLTGKIIKGGSGNWGEMLMTPHPDISEEDAKAMVAYILNVNQK